jgi:protein-disulfide isomerase
VRAIGAVAGFIFAALVGAGLIGCSQAPTGLVSSSAAATQASAVASMQAGATTTSTPDVVTGDNASGESPPPIEHPTLADLAVAGPLGDRFLGRPDARLTIVEYASLTCPHCRAFQTDVFDQVKKAYIDTGKVRWVLREFPIGHTSGAAWIVNRCASEKLHFKLYDTFMRNQKDWVSLEVRRDAIAAVAMKGGMTGQQFDACWGDAQTDAGLRWVKARGRQLGVSGTPTFFIGATKIRAVPSFQDFSAIIDAELLAPGSGMQVAIARAVVPPPAVK